MLTVDAGTRQLTPGPSSTLDLDGRSVTVSDSPQRKDPATSSSPTTRSFIFLALLCAAWIVTSINFPLITEAVLGAENTADGALEEFNQREKVAEKAYLIRTDAETVAPHSYAGIYMDHLDGGRIKVLFKDIPEGYLKRLSSFFPYPERVDLLEVKYSMEELLRAHDAAVGNFQQLSAEGVELNSADLDERANRVFLGVAGLTPSEANLLLERFGDAVVPVEGSPAKEQSHPSNTAG